MVMGPHIESLYGTEQLDEQRARYRSLQEQVIAQAGEKGPVHFVSTPGRTELGGNHTDHNHGKVLCAAVQQDTVAATIPREDCVIRLTSVGFGDRWEVSLENLGVQPGDRGSTRALIRGVADGLHERGYVIGGFDAVVDSRVPVGSGLSSSASFEVLVGGILSLLYNDFEIPPVVLAQVGKRAENLHFGKPCGLMDQLGCAVGGILAIDFQDLKDPAIRKIEVDFSATPYNLCVVDTGGSHGDLTDAYASIPGEMTDTAKLFGGEVLRDLKETVVQEHPREIRERLGDRALLRALHYFRENRRVEQMFGALERKNFEAYLQLVAASGASSAGALQNIIPPGEDGREQPTAVALAFAHAFFEERGRGVARIHGGGFAGTIQVYVHREDYADFVELMETLFRPGCVSPLAIRPIGVTRVSVEN